MKKNEVCLFFGVFFKDTEELAAELDFVKKKIGKYNFFSGNTPYKRFPITDELSAVFYGDSPPDFKDRCSLKFISLAKGWKLNKIHRLITKINKFQRKVKKKHGFICPMLIGYIEGKQVILIYKSQALFSIRDPNSTLYHKVEMILKGGFFSEYIGTLPLLRKKEHITFLNDLKRLL